MKLSTYILISAMFFLLSCSSVERENHKQESQIETHSHETAETISTNSTEASPHKHNDAHMRMRTHKFSPAPSGSNKRMIDKFPLAAHLPRNRQSG